jgi:hypothetical protein
VNFAPLVTDSLMSVEYCNLSNNLTDSSSSSSVVVVPSKSEKELTLRYECLLLLLQ